MKKILLYEDREKIKENIKNSCMKLQISLIIIGDNSVNLTLEEAFNMECDDLSEHSLFDSSYMLMEEISDETLTTLLNSLNVEYDGIKVRHTLHNGTWILKDLFRETEKEHKLVKKLFILQERLEECNSLEYSTVSNEKRCIFQDELLHAFLLLHSKNNNEEEVDASIHLLEEQIKYINKK